MSTGLAVFAVLVGLAAINCVLVHYVPERVWARAQRYGAVALGCFFVYAAATNDPVGDRRKHGL